MDSLGLSIPEVCRTTGIGRTTIYEEIRAGRLRALKLGRRTIIRTTDLQKWLDALPELRRERA